jgi:hypothetical protein
VLPDGSVVDPWVVGMNGNIDCTEEATASSWVAAQPNNPEALARGEAAMDGGVPVACQWDRVASYHTRYITALYWAVTTMSTVGYGDISASTDAEKTFSVVAMLLGTSVFTPGDTFIFLQAALCYDFLSKVERPAEK